MGVNMKIEKIKQKYSGLIIIIAVLLLLPSILYAAKNFTPTPKPLNRTANAPTITPTLSPKKIVVSQTAKPFREQLMDKIEKRVPLSAADNQVKSTILSKIQADRTIHRTTLYTIEYTRPLDLFKVKINTTDIEKAKIEGNAWFLSQGMSQKGICDLPLQFYLNFDVLQQVPELKNTFNPLPLDCYSE